MGRMVISKRTPNVPLSFHTAVSTGSKHDGWGEIRKAPTSRKRFQSNRLQHEPVLPTARSGQVPRAIDAPIKQAKSRHFALLSRVGRSVCRFLRQTMWESAGVFRSATGPNDRMKRNRRLASAWRHG